MKLLVEFRNKKAIDMTNCDGLILALKDYSVTGKDTYTLEEIMTLKNKYKDKDIFVSLNKNFFNKDIENLKEILKQLASLKITGIFFYDQAILQLKKELDLNIDLVWNQTHMVNNYLTCNYYYEKGVKYALLGKELTLEEISAIIKNTSLKCMVEVVSKPNIAYSKRKLLTNFYKDLAKAPQKELLIQEKITKENYLIEEEESGTAIYKDELINGTSIIKDLKEANCEYIIMRDDLEKEADFQELLFDTTKYLKGNCQDESYLKYQKLGTYTGFFFNKTIYRVKKNG